MKKKIVLSVLFMFIAVATFAQAKYVFYFIGDGMGVNQVNGTEMYRAALQGRIGVQPLLFTQFPVGTVASTFSFSNPVTDSAAAGTALSTGTKTYNGAIALSPDKKDLITIAEKAKKAGKRVGITTTVSVDHATPAVFYAHQPQRQMYYEIATDLPKSGFDFFAGSGFLKPTTTAEGKQARSVFELFAEKGYTVARGLNDVNAKADKAQKMILIQTEDKDQESLPFALDRKDDDLKLADITASAIRFLTKNNNKGFFLMCEGGKIDWACHDNDAATVFNEVVDMDNAIRVAYEFYKKHPKETLIVITADHETGGITLGNDHYEMNLQALQYQKVSVGVLSKKMADLRKQKNNKVNWGDMKVLLSQELGFWDKLPISWKNEKMLRDAFEASFDGNQAKYDESLYSKNEAMATTAKVVMDRIAMVNWAHGSHTAGYVPVFAVGAGSELFKGKMDNTDIPKRIAQAARY